MTAQRDTHFEFRGIRLPYLDHPYNKASRNMRSVEVPIVRRYIRETRKAKARSRILEVGNVMGHYRRRSWQVVDLREKGRRIHNVDIMQFYPSMQFDLIVGISTLEHIGYGRYEKAVGAPTTPRDVVDKLRGILAPDGTILLTAPMGYNATLDEQIQQDVLGVDYGWFLQRISDANEWEQCNKAAALALPFNGRWRWGNACAILQVGDFEWTDCGFEVEEMEKQQVLNLGAGNAIKPNAINHDVAKHRAEIDVAHDLNLMPWPWADEEFGLIIARSVFEHLDIDLLTAMNETWRILKPGGRIYVKLPYWKHDRCYTDPTHRRGYTLGTFHYFDPATEAGMSYRFYSGCYWKIDSPKYPRFNSARTGVMATLTKIDEQEARARLRKGRKQRKMAAAQDGQSRQRRNKK